MPYSRKKKQEYDRRNSRRRRAYFRRYNRRNKDRLKMVALMGGIGKLMEANKIISDQIVSKTEAMRKSQAKIDFKINQIKKFINLK